MICKFLVARAHVREHFIESILMNIKITNDLLYADKPDGVSTHAPSPERRGFVEYLEQKLGRKLFIVHRLDQTTSGAMVFALSAEKAEEIRQLFVRGEVKKKYRFLTDRQSAEASFSVRSEIHRQGQRWMSDPRSAQPKAKTSFQRIKRSPFFELWEAQPTTGKAHQIRLHARDLGLPILGDPIYGGTPFPRLCLHSLSLQLGVEPLWECPPPRIFERLGLLRDISLASLVTEIDRRQRLFNFLSNPEQCYCLIDREDLALELLGPQLWVSWFIATEPSAQDLERLAFVGRLLDRPLLVQPRPDRGRSPGPTRKSEIGIVPESWTAKEGAFTFKLQKSSGESSGLFLDQRAQREQLFQRAQGKRVLNLFAYTGGFSVAAIKGGATCVTHVDLNPNANAWAEENLRLNGLPGGLPGGESEVEFFDSDVFFFLDRAMKKGRQWDLIVCDPPVFSRSAGRQPSRSVFRIEKDLQRLLEGCRQVLAPQGSVLFSTHFTHWTAEELRGFLETSFPQANIRANVTDWDFSEAHPLKSFWIEFAEPVRPVPQGLKQQREALREKQGPPRERRKQRGRGEPREKSPEKRRKQQR
ncbi:MAG: hypothetical protein C5B49_04380 [Bdellovibrio sp.]|nr:MAG: hypothetical protein C5B49_04380 [Bdellovibrio sp.]